jgi:hypothetical protein
MMIHIFYMFPETNLKPKQNHFQTLNIQAEKYFMYINCLFYFMFFMIEMLILMSSNETVFCKRNLKI